jgi:Tfp pilus assembly PilM family ATPase
MPRLLALEWDNREVRVAVATPRGGGAVIEDAFVIPLPPQTAGADVDVSIGEVIAAALAEKRVGRVVALAAVGRAGIELKELSLPPAPDDELPDLVRFQALREFHSLGEDWPLDFIPLATPPAAPRKVLAAAVSPQLIEQIRQACLQAKITPEHLVLRPCAAASLLTRARWEAVARVKLLVDLLAEEADLTVLVDNEVVFMRTVRLSGDASATLVGEIRRTVAAARNQIGGLTIEAVYLCSGAEHNELTAQIESQVGIVTHLFDPFSGLTLSNALKRNLPASSGRFAPVLGMLLDEAQQKRHTIDFLNPRRRPPPPSQRRRLVWSATAACVVLAAGFSWLNSSLSAMDDEIAELRTQSKSLDKPAEKAKEIEKAAQEIGAWADADVNWLDELRELALDMPPSRDVLLTRLTMGTTAAAPTGRPGAYTAQMDLEGLLRGADSAAQLEAALRDEFHTVQGRSLQQDSSRPGYSWKFISIIAAKPETGENYRMHAEAAVERQAAAKAAEAEGRSRFGGGFPGFGGFPQGFDGGGWPGWGDDSAPATQPKASPGQAGMKQEKSQEAGDGQ